MRYLILLSLFCAPLLGSAQPAETVAKLIRATERLQLRTAQVDSFVQVIKATSTHRHLPTAKAVWDLLSADTVFTTARLSGIGTVASPLDIAQQGAKPGQVLRWTGSTWFPHGTNMYDVVTTSGAVDSAANQIIVDTISAPITLNLPPCNPANDGVSFKFFKGGPDTHAVTIDPAGSELFSDGAMQKSIFNSGTSIECTCVFLAGVGRWFFHTM
jgi:hypothetical protein